MHTLRVSGDIYDTEIFDAEPKHLVIDTDRDFHFRKKNIARAENELSGAETLAKRARAELRL